MNRSSEVGLDRRAIRRSFERAAHHYDAAAILQREIGDRLISRLEFIRLTPTRILDVGCGTGHVTRALHRLHRRAHLVGVDIAPSMVRIARCAMNRFLPWRLGERFHRIRFATADATRLPFSDRSFDLVVSNLALQWCEPDRFFAECRRVLRPGGLLLFTSFGPDTLTELRAAWGKVDRNIHVHDFSDMHDLGDALVHARFADPVMDAERLTVTYAGVEDLMRDLKGIGAHNAASSRAAGLTGKLRFARFRSEYESNRRADGLLPATFEVVYGHAWMPESLSGAGVTTVPVESLQRRRP